MNVLFIKSGTQLYSKCTHEDFTRTKSMLKQKNRLTGKYVFCMGHCSIITKIRYYNINKIPMGRMLDMYYNIL